MNRKPRARPFDVKATRKLDSTAKRGLSAVEPVPPPDPTVEIIHLQQLPVVEVWRRERARVVQQLMLSWVETLRGFSPRNVGIEEVIQESAARCC